MLFASVPDPEELDMLVGVVDDYCRENGIERLRDREHVASLVVTLFENGHPTADDLKVALAGVARDTRH